MDTDQLSYSSTKVFDASFKQKGTKENLNVEGIHGRKDLLTEKVRITVKGLNSISVPVEAFEHNSISLGNAS